MLRSYPVQSTFVASWCPVSPQSGWFAFAITDPALFHGTLFHWAAHKANAGNGIDRDSPEILAHKLEAMRLVNERLGDPEQELKDETIAAVACLANVEVCPLPVSNPPAKHYSDLFWHPRSI